jgi:drug/metabolite transporter (DMT)-like permease
LKARAVLQFCPDFSISQKRKEAFYGLEKGEGFMSRQAKGILFILIACFFYSLRSVFVKLSVGASPDQIAFFRLVISSVLLTPIFWKNKTHLKTKKWKLHLFRGAIGFVAIYCSIYGIKHLSLVDAILLENTFPLFVPVICWLVQGRKIGLKSLFALVAGFSGIYLVLKPDGDFLSFGTIASLASGALSALSIVCLNELSKTERTITCVFYFYFISTVGSGITLATQFQMIQDPRIWLYLVVLGLLGPLFQFFMTKAYSLGAPHVIGGCTYSIVLLSIVWGWLIWGETLDSATIIGCAITICSGIYLILNEKPRVVEVGESTPQPQAPT